ncbi:MAG TPA: DUF4157 domain-containing protein, partial [Chitinophagaceae bacterium]|nr:DUF4157 domain-containing protein [Chitinophagaceae bacterium]
MRVPVLQNKTQDGDGHAPFFQKKNENTFFRNSESAFFHANSIQAKLTIGQPNDPFEQEADSVAGQVVQQMPATTHAGSESSTNRSISPIIHSRSTGSNETESPQGKVEEDNLLKGLQKKPIFESTAGPSDEGEELQRKCAECEKEEMLNKKEDSGGSSPPANIEHSLSSSRGLGSPLPEDTRSQMETSFGRDFENVRIHNDSSAIQLSKQLNAQAFTHGSDVYFNSGKYDTRSRNGKQLLAHELTHVVQQGKAGTGVVQKQPGPVTNVPSTTEKKEPAAGPQVPPVLFALDTAVRPPAVYFSVAFPGHKLVTIANYLYGRPEAVDELMAVNPGLGHFAQPGQAIKPLNTPLTPAAAALLEQNTRSGSVLRTLGIPTAPQKDIVVYSVTIPGTGDFKVTEQQFVALLNGSILWAGRKAAYYSELLRGFKEIRDDFLEERNSVVGGISDWLGDVSPPDSKYWDEPVKLADSIVLDLRGLKGLVPLEYFSAEINQDKELVQDIFRETNIPRLQVRLRENLALLVKVAEGEQIVNKRWHNFIEGTISGASVAVNT